MTKEELDNTLNAIEIALDDGLDQLDCQTLKDLGITRESIDFVRRYLSEFMSTLSIEE